MIKTVATNRYEKELKLMIKRGKDLNKLDYLLEILEANINKKISSFKNLLFSFKSPDSSSQTSASFPFKMLYF